MLSANGNGHYPENGDASLLKIENDRMLQNLMERLAPSGTPSWTPVRSAGAPSAMKPMASATTDAILHLQSLLPSAEKRGIVPLAGTANNPTTRNAQSRSHDAAVVASTNPIAGAPLHFAPLLLHVLCAVVCPRQNLSSSCLLSHPTRLPHRPGPICIGNFQRDRPCRWYRRRRSSSLDRGARQGVDATPQKAGCPIPNRGKRRQRSRARDTCGGPRKNYRPAGTAPWRRR